MNWNHEFRLSSPLDITAVAALPLPEHSENSANSARKQSARDFLGGIDYAEAIKLSERGWTGAPKLGDMAEKISTYEGRTSHEMHHAVTGAFVDVSRYIEGHPEDMMEFSTESAPRVFTLSVDIGKTCDVSTLAMELAGAVALAIIDTLSRSGMQVELYAYDANLCNQSTALTTFPLKRAHEPIDENQLAFWLCRPAALRSLIFGFWDTCPSHFYRTHNQGKGRGNNLKVTAEDLAVDYVLSCSPSTEEQARTEYARIISEIQSAI